MAAAAGLNIPSKALIGHELLVDCAAQGFTMIRIDCQDVGMAGDLEMSRQMIHEVLDAGLTPLAIIYSPAQMVNISQDALFCFWNEPNLVEHSLPRYIHHATCAAQMALYLERRLYLGGVSNPNLDGIAFLRALPWSHWNPLYVGCELHWYPHNAHGPTTAHPPFRSREDEIAAVHQIIEGRDRVIGEIGYNGQDYSEQQVADNLVWERAFWTDQNFSAVCVYQLNDGEDRTNILNTYGLKRLDTGEWKPAAAAFTEAI